MTNRFINMQNITYLSTTISYKLKTIMFFLGVYLCLGTVPSYGFSVNFNPDLSLNTKNTSHNHESDMILKINFGFIGEKNYQRRRNYSDNCFSYQCTDMGIQFKINLPNTSFLQ